MFYLLLIGWMMNVLEGKRSNISDFDKFDVDDKWNIVEKFIAMNKFTKILITCDDKYTNVSFLKLVRLFKKYGFKGEI